MIKLIPVIVAFVEPTLLVSFRNAFLLNSQSTRILSSKNRCSSLLPQMILMLPVSAFALDNLTQVLEAERDSEKFQPLPFHYVEISRLLFDQ